MRDCRRPGVRAPGRARSVCRSPFCRTSRCSVSTLTDRRSWIRTSTIDGTRLADTLLTFSDPPTAGDDRTPAQRRADAVAAAAAASTHPLGVSSVSLLVDAADFTEDGTLIPDGLLNYTTALQRSR